MGESMSEASNSAHCSICSKEYAYPENTIVSGIHAIPEGWLWLLEGTYKRDDAKLNIPKFSPICCSMECLKKMLQME